MRFEPTSSSTCSIRNKTPYAKQGLPVGPFPIGSAKRQALDALLKAKRPHALVIDGFDLTAAHIAGSLGLESYIATRRDGGVDVDGRLYLEREIICAEEVLALMRPEVVVGCPSTSLAAARSMHVDIPTFCITTPEALRIRGPRFNAVFRSLCRRLRHRLSQSQAVSRLSSANSDHCCRRSTAPAHDQRLGKAWAIFARKITS